MANHDLRGAMNIIAGTTKKDAQGAANAWAGTVGHSLQAALNEKIGRLGWGLRKAANWAAGTSHADAHGALSTLAEYGPGANLVDDLVEENV